MLNPSSLAARRSLSSQQIRGSSRRANGARAHMCITIAGLLPELFIVAAPAADALGFSHLQLKPNTQTDNQLS